MPNHVPLYAVDHGLQDTAVTHHPSRSQSQPRIPLSLAAEGEPVVALPECPACGQTRHRAFIDLGTLPRSGNFGSRPSDQMSRHRLRFVYCESCGLISQPVQGMPTIDYTDVSRRTKHQLPAYTHQIASRLLGTLTDDTRDLVVEVGANDGTFLSVLAEAGVVNRLGIEPSQSLSGVARAAGHPIINAPLDLPEAQRIVAQYGPAKAVMCRHTLEHVANPLSLLRAMRALLDDSGSLYIEVPSVLPIVEQLRAHELWDEHISYFSPASLRALVERAGFIIHDVESKEHRGSSNILLWAQPATAPVQTRVPIDQRFLAQCQGFAGKWEGIRRRLQAQARQWPQPLMAMGASHLQSNFLLFSGLGAQVQALVDDDAVKVGRYVALPQCVPVIDTDTALASRWQGGTLLLTAFGYPEWTQRLRSAFETAAYLVVDPLESIEGN